MHMYIYICVHKYTCIYNFGLVEPWPENMCLLKTLVMSGMMFLLCVFVLKHLLQLGFF